MHKLQATHHRTSDFIKEWPTHKLKKEAREYHELIYGNSSCYSTHDLIIYDCIWLELDRRGVALKTELTFI